MSEPNDVIIKRSLMQDSRRDIYEAKYPAGEYFISYQGGGPFPQKDVLAMVEDGVLERKYPNCECYVLSNIQPTPPKTGGREGEKV